MCVERLTLFYFDSSTRPPVETKNAPAFEGNPAINGIARARSSLTPEQREKRKRAVKTANFVLSLPRHAASKKLRKRAKQVLLKALRQTEEEAAHGGE